MTSVTRLWWAVREKENYPLVRLAAKQWADLLKGKNTVHLQEFSPELGEWDKTLLTSITQSCTSKKCQLFYFPCRWSWWNFTLQWNTQSLSSGENSCAQPICLPVCQYKTNSTMIMYIPGYVFTKFILLKSSEIKNSYNTERKISQ